MTMELIVSVLSGLVTIIPVLFALYKLFKKYVQEKNWAKLVALVLNLCQEAEDLLEDGEQKKRWVLNALRASAAETGYELDEASLAEVSTMIDEIIKATRNINTSKEKAAEKAELLKTATQTVKTEAKKTDTK